ncbi:fibroblast growth factor 21-like [Heptranchias perlo]|uniref:fibroblast growth factor 21-like n=1 Tax=Heptranchias perlo TaxID=212740 RepID=UPI0035597182
MSHSVSAPCVVLILAMCVTELIESTPVGQPNQNNHGQGHDLPATNQHPILYVQINDDGHVNKSRHQNDYTLMDIAFTKSGIVIKGRKSARYLCSHPNNILYSMFQLKENCKFKEGSANGPLNDQGNSKKLNLSPVTMHSECVKSGHINPNLPDPLGMIEC